MITKYGYTSLGVITLIVFLLIALSFLVNNNLVKAVLIILPLAFLVFSINFFRDPERTTPALENVVVSPADGKVLFIKDVVDAKFIEGKGKQVSIFMSPLNVHVNRIPISGVMKSVEYYEGEFIAAFEDKATEVNERSEFVIESKYGNIFFTQVAGAIARRIIYELEPGQQVIMGERFGMIKFGSRVDVVVSDEWEVKIKKDDIVKAGESILFEFRK
jgi:phosphatidylserine decarboxylase